jgi:hypothetical protein
VGGGAYLDANLLIYALVLLLNLLFKLLDGGSVRRGAVSLEDLDISEGGDRSAASSARGEGRSEGRNALIGKRRDLLLFNLVVGEGLLVLLPVLTGGGRLWPSSVLGGASSQHG